MQSLLDGLTMTQCHQIIIKAFSNRGGLELVQSLLVPDSNQQQPNPDPDPDPDPRGLSWCICGKCRPMPLALENVCCRQSPCITMSEMFDTNVLNRDVLSIAIVSSADVLASHPIYNPASYRKAAYRQWIMWQRGYMGRGVRRVVPSCVVLAVKSRFPAPDGNYLGFKEYWYTTEHWHTI